MWSDIATGYGLFILEILTILLVIAGIAFMIVTLKQHKAKSTGELVVVDLSEEYQENSKRLREFSLSEETRKQLEKTQKKQIKKKRNVKKKSVKKVKTSQTSINRAFMSYSLKAILQRQRRAHYVKK